MSNEIQTGLIRKEYRGENNEVLYLIIDNPSELNALTTNMQISLIDELEKARIDKTVRVVVLRGAGEKAFSSGGSMSCLRELTTDEGRDALYDRGVKLRNTIEAMDKPVIAAVCGYAVGAGFEMAMCCDMLYASDTSRFSLPEVNLGLVPGWGGAIRLPRKLTVNRAKEIILLGEMVGAEEAYRVGIVNKIFPKEEFYKRVDEIVDIILSKPPLALRGIKAIVSHGIVDGNISVAQQVEHNLAIYLMSSKDFEEAVDAFEQKRPPEFKGE